MDIEDVTELKPCPFCGAMDYVGVAFEFEPDALFFVNCEPCGARTMGGNTEAEAIAAWNTRAPDPDRQADLIAKVQNGGQLICPGKHDPVDEGPDYAAMSPGEMYQALGGDAMKWATAFMQITGGKPMHHDEMLGWFANAMMASLDFQHGQPILCGDHAEWLMDEGILPGKHEGDTRATQLANAIAACGGIETEQLLADFTESAKAYDEAEFATAFAIVHKVFHRWMDA